MRILVLLATLGFAAAALTGEQKGECLVEGGEAINDAADAAMYIWAAYKRCNHTGLEIKCGVDVSSAVESVTSMVMVMAKAMDRCGHIKTANKECGIAAGLLVKDVAGLAAAATDYIQKCPNPMAGNHSAVPQFNHSLALCVVNIKDSAKSLMKLIKQFTEIKDQCPAGAKDTRPCVKNAFRIIGGFAAIGEFTAGAIGHCSAPGNGVNTPTALCAQAYSSIAHYTTKFAASATDLAVSCEKSATAAAKLDTQDAVVVEEMPINPYARLYEHGDGVRASSSTNLMLAAFIPVTAVLGYVGGRRWGARSTQYDHRVLAMSDGEE